MGVVQLAVPIVLYVRAGAMCRDADDAISLLDVVVNPLWAWLGVGEAPSSSAVAGGGLHRRRRAPGRHRRGVAARPGAVRRGKTPEPPAFTSASGAPRHRRR